MIWRFLCVLSNLDQIGAVLLSASASLALISFDKEGLSPNKVYPSLGDKILCRRLAGQFLFQTLMVFELPGRLHTYL